MLKKYEHIFEEVLNYGKSAVKYIWNSSNLICFGGISTKLSPNKNLAYLLWDINLKIL